MEKATGNSKLESRVLVCMPTGRDASLVCSTLEKADIAAVPCAAVGELEERLCAGAGALLIAEEALQDGMLERLAEWFEQQPVWSDLPVVLFAGNAKNSEVLLDAVGTRFNATIVERPIRIAMLVSAVRGALRARQRQYQARDLLEQLEQADRQKDLFLATLSHELRTPLNAMLGWIKLLRSEKDRAGGGVDINRGLDVIERNAKSQSKVISDILFLSRVVTGKLELKLEEVDLPAVVQAAIDTVLPSIEAGELSLQTSFDPAIKRIRGDADRLQQIFLNLLSNAIKFTPPQGKIEVRIRKRNGAAVVEVADTGQGIKPEFLPFVFERFRQADSSYTREIGGLGLGLAIVRHLVELHDGKVAVMSEGENRGTTFTVTLPIAKKSAPAVSGPTDAEPETTDPVFGEIHILLVEDDEDSREMLRVMFEQAGMQITAVDTVAGALEAFGRTRPDVIVSDVGLPGEDGYELMRRIRDLAPERGGQVPAIALTGYASLRDRTQALEAGYQEHLAKPVDLDKLLELIKKYVVRAAEND